MPLPWMLDYTESKLKSRLALFPPNEREDSVDHN